MTDLTSLDLVERLNRPVMYHSNPAQTNAERREAADEILRLRALTAPGEGCNETELLYAIGHGIRDYCAKIEVRSKGEATPDPMYFSGEYAASVLTAIRPILTRAEARANEAKAEWDAERVAHKVSEATYRELLRQAEADRDRWKTHAAEELARAHEAILERDAERAARVKAEDECRHWHEAYLHEYNKRTAALKGATP